MYSICLSLSTVSAHICVFLWNARTSAFVTDISTLYFLLCGGVIAQSVWCWAMDWTIGVLGFDFWWGLGIFLFTTASRTALGPTQPPIEWVAGALSLGVEQLGREADHSPPSNAEVKE
jgi:hypothetical protein